MGYLSPTYVARPIRDLHIRTPGWLVTEEGVEPGAAPKRVHWFGDGDEAGTFVTASLQLARMRRHRFWVSPLAMLLLMVLTALVSVVTTLWLSRPTDSSLARVTPYGFKTGP